MSRVEAASVDYRSPAWVMALGAVIERVGLWPAIAICTLLSQALTLLTILLISLFFIPLDVERAIVVGFVVSLLTTPIISYAVFRLIQDLSLTRKALSRIANHDGLTQAHTRRFFMNALAAPMPAASNRSEPESIVLLDVDNFKQINDRYGHPVGDTVLQAISDACRRELRREDLFARYGGEEFVILLTGAAPELARSIAERVRRAVAELHFKDAEGHQVPVTISLGIAHSGVRLRGAGAGLLEQALGVADQALYASKREGRNRFTFVALPDPTPLAA